MENVQLFPTSSFCVNLRGSPGLPNILFNSYPQNILEQIFPLGEFLSFIQRIGDLFDLTK